MEYIAIVIVAALVFFVCYYAVRGKLFAAARNGKTA